MSSYEQFTNNVLNAVTEIINKDLEGNNEELGARLHARFIELENPEPMARKNDAITIYTMKVFRGLTEIRTSLDMLKDITTYLRRFPYAKTSIPRDRYMRFHVEAFFNEIYILSERLERYQKLFSRQFKADPATPRAEELINLVFEHTAKALKQIIDIRGAHVHVQRLTEDNIDRLGTLELLWKHSKGPLSLVAKRNYESEFRRIKKEWTIQIRGVIESIENLLDTVFEVLIPIVFVEETNQIRRPHGIR